MADFPILTATDHEIEAKIIEILNTKEDVFGFRDYPSLRVGEIVSRLGYDGLLAAQDIDSRFKVLEQMCVVAKVAEHLAESDKVSTFQYPDNRHGGMVRYYARKPADNEEYASPY